MINDVVDDDVEAVETKAYIPIGNNYYIEKATKRLFHQTKKGMQYVRSVLERVATGEYRTIKYANAYLNRRISELVLKKC